VSHDEVLSAVSKFPLARKPGKKLPPRALPEPVFRRATVKSSYVSDGVGIYFPCPTDRLSKWRLAFALDLLTSSPFGILREKLRVREGLVYGVSSSFFGWPMALTEISAKAEPGNFSYLEAAFLEGIERVIRGDYPDELFQNQLAERKIGLARESEVSSRRGWIDSIRDSWLARLAGDPPSVRNLLATSREDLAAVAAKYLCRDKYGCLSAVHAKG
jgi:predicted Zn-dependent peptidase